MLLESGSVEIPQMASVGRGRLYARHQSQASRGRKGERCGGGDENVLYTIAPSF